MITWLQRHSWRILRLLSGFQERMRRRFTGAGQAVLAGTFLGGLFGIDTRQTLAFQLFSLGIALLVVAWLGSLRRPQGLTAHRQLPRHATVNAPMRYRVTVENHAPRPTPPLVLQERLPDPRPPLAVFLRQRAPGEQAINPLDRVLGYPRWRWLVQQGRRAKTSPSLPLAPIAAGAHITLELELCPSHRGPLDLQGLEAYLRDPLGLAQRPLTISPAQRLLVLPRRYPMPHQRPPGRRRLQPGGVGLAATLGDSREFIGLRDYRSGDSPRHIHWAAWARSGTPIVKEYQDEYFSRQALILDSFPPSERTADFEAAISVAASFVEPLQGGDALLDLIFVADQAYTLTGGRGLLSSTALLEVLASLEARANGEFTTLSQAVLGHAVALSACLCVLLDWDTARRSLVQQLRILGLPVRVLVVGGPSELEPGPMADSPHNLHRLDPNGLAAGLAAINAPQ